MRTKLQENMMMFLNFVLLLDKLSLAHNFGNGARFKSSYKSLSIFYFQKHFGRLSSEISCIL